MNVKILKIVRNVNNDTWRVTPQLEIVSIAESLQTGRIARFTSQILNVGVPSPHPRPGKFGTQDCPCDVILPAERHLARRRTAETADFTIF